MSQINLPIEVVENKNITEVKGIETSSDELNKLLSTNIEKITEELYKTFTQQQNKKTSSKEDLLKKLRSKINDKSIMRKNDNIKKDFADKKLKESGIDDIEKFKESIKKMDPEKLLNNLKL